MDGIEFSDFDVGFLYAIPEKGGDIRSLVHSYVFVNRAAPPKFDELQLCVVKALRAGILEYHGKRLIVRRDWFERIHAADSTAKNEIYSMIEFEEYLLGKLWPVEDAAAEFSIDRAEYEAAVHPDNSFPAGKWIVPESFKPPDSDM